MGSTDEELLARVRSGDDRAAFAELVRRHQAKVRSLLRRLTCGDHAKADDLAQETFLRAFRAAGQFEGRAQLSTWLCTIAYRTFLAARRAGREELARSGDELEDQEIGTRVSDAMAKERAAPDRALLRHDVERALARLPPAERDALALTFGRDMTHEDAARILGCPLGTLKTNVARGLAKLERHMRPWSETS